MNMGRENRTEMDDVGNGTRRILFRDDDRNGFAFQVFRGIDGDFYLGMAVVNEDADDFDREQYSAIWARSVRVRMPMIGGGSQPELYATLVELFKAIPAPTGSEARND